MSKKGLLPKVSEEVLEKIISNLGNDESNTYVPGILDRLVEDNPVILEFIANYTSAMAEEAKGVYLGAIIYALLEAKAEEDYLSNFNDPKAVN